MKIYLASCFNLVDIVQLVADYLKTVGHTITVEWWAKDGFDLRDKKNNMENPEGFYEDPICKLIYERDYIGVLHSDALVIVAGSQPKAFNGANVEYGIALAFNKPCFSIGKLDNSAMYYPVHQCKSLFELEEELGKLK